MKFWLFTCSVKASIEIAKGRVVGELLLRGNRMTEVTSLIMSKTRYKPSSAKSEPFNSHTLFLGSSIHDPFLHRSDRFDI